MRRRSGSWLIAARRLLCAVLLSAHALDAGAQALRIGGTGSALGTMRQLAQAFSKQNSAPAAAIAPNLGSSGGLRALKAGAIDIALISRPLKSEERADGLVAYEYGSTPFVFVTQKKDVSNITTAAVAEYLSGRSLAWPDGEPVRIVLRPPHDGDNALLAAFSPAIAAALKIAHQRKGIVVAATDQDAADAAEHLPGSLAVNSLALIMSERRKLNVLAFNGIEPTVQALADWTYHYGKSLRLVTRGPPAGTAKQFVDFVRSAQGRAILEANGHLVPR